MASPFPGMNPYFELPGFWMSFHNGPYAAAINYHDPVPPPISEEENQFVQTGL